MTDAEWLDAIENGKGTHSINLSNQALDRLIALARKALELETELAETEAALSGMNERYDAEHPRWVFGR